MLTGNQLRVALERKKIPIGGNCSVLADYIDVGDVRLYMCGMVVLGETSFGAKVEIRDFVFGAGFVANRKQGCRTLVITPPDGEQPLEFVHRGPLKGWEKLVPLVDPTLDRLTARFGERIGGWLYRIVQLGRM